MNPDAAPAPRITVLLPTHNRAGFLPDAVRSAQAQTLAPLEILILDNVSTDATPAVAAGFAAADPRVRYVRHDRNLQITGNWRRGIELCRGDFFCLLHDDDTLEPDFLARLAAPLLADPTLVLSFCDHWVADAAGRRLPAETEASTRRWKRDRLPAGRVADLAAAVLLDHSLMAGAALFRRSRVLPEFIDDRARGGIDYWLFYQILRTGAGAFYVPARLLNYRVHGGGMSHARASMGMNAGHLFRFEHLLADENLARFHPAVRRERAAVATGHGVDLLAAGRRAEARGMLGRALGDRFFNPRALAALALAGLGAPGSAFARRLLARHANAAR